MKTRIAALLAFALTACADIDESGEWSAEATNNASEQSLKGAIGTRLRPYALAANDGTTGIVPGLWYDTELSIACAFKSNDGGDELHCIPESVGVPKGYFADDACTQPIAIMEDCPNLPRFVREVDPTACNTTVGLRPLGKQLQSKSNWYLSGHTCIAQQPLASHFVAFPMFDVMPWTDFVSGVQTPAP